MTTLISDQWLELSERYPDIASRCGDAVYALPETLISAIQELVPALFSRDELPFELHLARTGATGFFLKQPFYDPILSAFSGGVRQSKEAIDEEIKELLTEEATAIGRSGSTVDDYLKAADEREEAMRLRQAGYVGWLISEPNFRMEMADFISRWKRTIARTGRFPAVRKSLLGERTNIPKKSREFWTEAMILYRRWGLETCLTWELPVPLHPGLETRDFYNRDHIEAAGLHIFIPHYLLRDRDLSVYDIVESQRCLTDDSHLAGWFDRRKPNWGYERYTQMLELYVYLELSIRRCYGDRLRGQTRRLDEAFTRFWLDSNDDLQVFTRTESTAKTRQKLQRRLKSFRARR